MIKFDNDTGWYRNQWSYRRIAYIGNREFRTVVGPLAYSNTYWATVNEVGAPTEQRFGDSFETVEDAKSWCEHNLKELI